MPQEARIAHQQLSAALRSVNEKLDTVITKHDEFEKKIAPLVENAPALAEMADIYLAGRGAFRVGGWWGKFIAWVAAFIASMAVIWASVKSGAPTK